MSISGTTVISVTTATASRIIVARSRRRYRPIATATIIVIATTIAIVRVSRRYARDITAYRYATVTRRVRRIRRVITCRRQTTATALMNPATITATALARSEEEIPKPITPAPTIIIDDAITTASVRIAVIKSRYGIHTVTVRTYIAHSRT